jgi:hypothetical protein
MNRSTRAQDRIVDILALMQKQACELCVLEEWATQAHLSTIFL